MPRHLSYILPIFLGIGTAFAQEREAVSVSLYPVYQQQVAGTKHVTNPKGSVNGFVFEKPELEITELAAVAKWTEEIFVTSIALDGTKKNEVEEHPCLILKLSEVDSIQYGKLTDKFDHQQVLIYIGGELRSAPVIMGRNTSGKFIIRCTDENERSKLFHSLQVIVRTKAGEPAGADQPATKPADKPSVKDQPSTPTPKGGPR